MVPALEVPCMPVPYRFGATQPGHGVCWLMHNEQNIGLVAVVHVVQM